MTSNTPGLSLLLIVIWHSTGGLLWCLFVKPCCLIAQAKSARLTLDVPLSAFRPAVQSYHQQYLARGGRFGQPQDSTKGCTGTLCMYEWDVRAGVHARFWSRIISSVTAAVLGSFGQLPLASYDVMRTTPWIAYW